MAFELFSDTTAGQCALVLKERTQVKYDDLHSFLGHIGEEQVCATAKNLESSLVGKPKRCEHCAINKACQKKSKKTLAEDKTFTTAGEHSFLDISSIKASSFGGSKFWLLVVDDATDMSWSIFLKHKSELSKRMTEFLQANLVTSKEGV